MTPRPLADCHGRVATDLRVSLTDRCNLRCSYCMPAEGLTWLPSESTLTDDELGRVIRIGVEMLGIRTLRFTGGEPLLRRGLIDIVARAAQLRTDEGRAPELALTTNGLGLDKLAGGLAQAGLHRINVSLDSLRPQTYAEITRRDRLADVLAGLAAARAAGLGPIKINAVLIRDLNEHEAPDLLEWALAEGFELRFIEQMPLDPQKGWSRDTMVTADDTLALLRRHHDLQPVATARGSAPAELFAIDGGPHTVGIIGSVTRPFCGTCDRVRLTADGQIRNCLFAREESDLRAALRAGASDDELATRWLAAVASKRAGHGIDDPTFLQPDRPMSAIGG